MVIAVFNDDLGHREPQRVTEDAELYNLTA